MASIRTIPPAAADGELAQAYAEIERRAGAVANIYRAQSLSPLTLLAHDRLHCALMHGPGPLSRAQRELLAVAVSQANLCHY